MIPDERRKQILTLLDQKGYISVEDLARELYVSLPTIRRDLAWLEKEGSILRTHGGASFNQPDTFSSPFALRKKENQEEKMRIGRMAASMIQNNDTIFINSSSTCFCFAKNIDANMHLTVLTNGMPLAHHLAEYNNITVECPAGVYNYIHEGIYGSTVEEMIRKRHAKYYFTSCNGLDLNYGVTTISNLDIPMIRACRKNCDHLVLLVDHTKWNQSYYYRLMEMEDIDIIITDQNPGKEWLEYGEEHGIEIMYE